MISKIAKIKGFTLVELLIGLGIFSMLLLVLIQLFTAILDVEFDTEATSSVQEDSKYLFARFNYDIQRAEAIIVPTTYGIQSSSLIILINGVNHVYSLNNGNLLLGLDRLNSSDTTVSDLEFTRLGEIGEKDTIRVTFNLTSEAIRKSGPESKNFQTTIGQR